MDSENQHPYQNQLPPAPDAVKEKPIVNIQREKSFFERPIGNVAGWLILVMLVYFSWYLLTHGLDPEKSVLLVVLTYGNFLAYLWRWWDGRRKRRA